MNDYLILLVSVVVLLVVSSICPFRCSLWLLSIVIDVVLCLFTNLAVLIIIEALLLSLLVSSFGFSNSNPRDEAVFDSVVVFSPICEAKEPGFVEPYEEW